MSRILAFSAIAVLTSCSFGPTPNDESFVVAATLASLYSQIDQDVLAAGLCLSGKRDVPAETIAKVERRKIEVIQCSELDLSDPGARLRIKKGEGFAVQLSVDKVTFASSSSATVIAHYSYGGLAAEGFTFDLRKTGNGWSVSKQRDLWIS